MHALSGICIAPAARAYPLVEAVTRLLTGRLASPDPAHRPRAGKSSRPSPPALVSTLQRQSRQLQSSRDEAITDVYPLRPCEEERRGKSER